MSFGTVFRAKDDVIELLKDTGDALRDKIEFDLKIKRHPEAVSREVEAEREDIRHMKEDILSDRQESTYFARMRLGRLVEWATRDKCGAYVRTIYAHLKEFPIVSRHNKPLGDKMILNAAFLVERDQAALFDEKVQEIAQRYDGKLRFGYTGPGRSATS